MIKTRLAIPASRLESTVKYLNASRFEEVKARISGESFISSMPASMQKVAKNTSTKIMLFKMMEIICFLFIWIFLLSCRLLILFNKLIKIYYIDNDKAKLHDCRWNGFDADCVAQKNDRANCINNPQLYHRSHEHRNNYQKRPGVANHVKNKLFVHVYIL